MINPLDLDDKPKKKYHAPKVEAEETVDVTPEKKAPVQAETAKPQNIIVHSELDSMVLDRLKSQPDTLTAIDAEVIVKPKDEKHALSLPDELLQYTKKYAFCWIFKRKQAIDEACDQLHYKLTNRTFFPELPDHCFSARGVIERGDNILMFRPMKIDIEMRLAPGIESTERIKARTSAHENDPNYYVPKPEDGEKNVVGV